MNQKIKNIGSLAFLIACLAIFLIFYLKKDSLKESAPPSAAVSATPKSELESLFDQLASSSDPNERAFAATRLGTLRDPSAVDPLLWSLADPDANVRSAAAGALGPLGDQRAVDPLIGLLSDATPSVRVGAVYSLGRLGDMRAVAPLDAALSDADPGVRANACSGLGNLFFREDDTYAGIPIVVTSIAEKEPDATVERKGTAADVLLNLLAAMGDPEPDVRYRAAFALGEIRNPFAVDTLILALHDEYSLVRIGAAYALGEIKDSRGVAPLIAMSEKPLADNEIYNIYSALAEFNDPRVEKILMAAFQQRNWKILSPAHAYFVPKANPETEQVLVELLKKTNNLEIADTFLRSSNTVLQRAGKTWAEEHDFHFEQLPNGEWGWREMH